MINDWTARCLCRCWWSVCGCWCWGFPLHLLPLGVRVIGLNRSVSVFRWRIWQIVVLAILRQEAVGRGQLLVRCGKGESRGRHGCGCRAVIPLARIGQSGHWTRARRWWATARSVGRRCLLYNQTSCSQHACALRLSLGWQVVFVEICSVCLIGGRVVRIIRRLVILAGRGCIAGLSSLDDAVLIRRSLPFPRLLACGGGLRAPQTRNNRISPWACWHRTCSPVHRQGRGR